MIGKKINQLATELAPVSTDLTIIGDPISGVSKKITLAQLGAIFSGAVSFYTNLASFPAVGDINVIYCAKDTQKLYLWNGSAYTEVFPAQALLDTYQLRSEKGVSNGYASLDSGGKVPISQLPSSIMEYKGMWNAATNTPTLANGTGDTGDVYICNVAGTVNFGAGPLTFAVGDYVIYSGSIWQRSSGAVGTVTSVGLTITGDAVGVSNSPITTSGTLALAFGGTNLQFINGAGNLTTFPILTGFVPYTGATANVDLGTFDLTADVITGATGSYTSSGGGNTLNVTHSSGSGIALNITKGGNGEGLYINKTSGSGNAVTIIGTLNATTLVKSGGTSSQFLKADGSVDSSTYYLASNPNAFITLASLSAGAGISYNNTTGVIASTITQYTDAMARASVSLTTTGTSGAATYNSTTGVFNIPNYAPDLSGYVPTSRTITINGTTLDLSANRSYSVGTVTSVGLSSATSGVTIGSTPITTSGTITLAIATASGSQQGLLSSTDWTTFNNKQNALTNPVTGTGTTNYLPKFTGASTIGNSVIQEASGSIGINVSPVADFQVGKSSGVTIAMSNSSSVTSGTRGGLTWYNSNVSTVADIRAVAVTDNVGTQLEFYTRPVGGSLTQAMTLNASGNLGLGVTPSAWGSSAIALQIRNGSIWNYNNADNLIIASNNYFDVTNAAYRYVITGFASEYTQDQGKHIWRIAPSGTAGNAISFTQAMTLNASGNLSVGNTNDSFKLDVSGTGRFTGAVGTPVTLTIASGNSNCDITMQSANSSSVSRIRNGTNDLQFHTNGSLALTIASTGAATFSSSVTATQFNSTGGRGTSFGYKLPDWQIYNTTSGNALAFSNYTSDLLYITSGGNVEINTGSIKTGEPDTGWGRAAVKIGASVSGISFNTTRYLPVSVDGTVYYINLNSSTP